MSIERLRPIIVGLFVIGEVKKGLYGAGKGNNSICNTKKGEAFMPLLMPVLMLWKADPGRKSV